MTGDRNLALMPVDSSQWDVRPEKARGQFLFERTVPVLRENRPRFTREPSPKG